jgi:hypothetical protein
LTKQIKDSMYNNQSDQPPAKAVDQDLLIPSREKGAIELFQMARAICFLRIAQFDWIINCHS